MELRSVLSLVELVDQLVLQTVLFLAAFVFAPTHGTLAARRRAKTALREAG